jgi:hypothetical protein
MVMPNENDPQSRKPLIEDQKVVAVLVKNRDQELRVTTVTIDRKTYIGIAVHLKEGGAFRHGCTLAPSLVEQLLPVLAKLLDDLASPVRPDGEGSF